MMASNSDGINGHTRDIMAIPKNIDTATDINTRIMRSKKSIITRFWIEHNIGDGGKSTILMTKPTQSQGNW